MLLALGCCQGAAAAMSHQLRSTLVEPADSEERRCQHSTKQHEALHRPALTSL